MGLFDGVKSYEHEINEIRQYLIKEKRMNAQYANPFISAYGKEMGKLIEDGRKKALGFNTSMPMGEQLNREFAHNGVRFSVLGQAIRAYLGDLRSGRYVNTAVESAIWGIILDEDPELVDGIKLGLSEFVRSNYQQKVPNACDVFDSDSSDQLLQDRRAGQQSIARAREKQESILPLQQPKRDLSSASGKNSGEHRVYTLLVAMLGRKQARGSLNRLMTNDRVRQESGIKNVPEDLELRVLLGLKWLAAKIANRDTCQSTFQSLRSAIVNVFSIVFGMRGYVMTDRQVSDLIKDVLSYMDEGECYISGPKGTYLRGLEDYCLD